METLSSKAAAAHLEEPELPYPYGDVRTEVVTKSDLIGNVSFIARECITTAGRHGLIRESKMIVACGPADQCLTKPRKGTTGRAAK